MDPDKKDEATFLNAFHEAVGKTYVFKCKAKMDTYNETPRMRNQVISASPPNWSQECAKLASL